MIRFGSLFSGIGGLDLGLERAGMECAWQVELDEFCLKILNKHWPDVRKYKDVKETHGIMAHTHSERQESELRETGNGGEETQAPNPELSSRGSGGNTIFRADCPACLEPVDLIAGGFPCQPHSVAGKRKGAEDNRNLWPEFIRIIKELKPRYVLGENVPGIVTTYIDTVLSDLEGEGYTCTTFNIPAVAFDAPHRRERIFVVAYTSVGGNGTEIISEKIERSQTKRSSSGLARSSHGGRKEDVADPPSRSEQSSSTQRNERGFQNEICGKGRYQSYFAIEPDVGRVAHGVPSRVDRLRGLGNAVVPQVAEWIGKRIIEFDEST